MIRVPAVLEAGKRRPVHRLRQSLKNRVDRYPVRKKFVEREFENMSCSTKCASVVSAMAVGRIRLFFRKAASPAASGIRCEWGRQHVRQDVLETTQQ